MTEIEFKKTIHDAMELIENELLSFACNALKQASSTDREQLIVDRFSKFYDKPRYVEWYDPCEHGNKSCRLMALALFAEIGYEYMKKDLK